MGKNLNELLKRNPPRNIIVRMPNWLGDLIMATPILRDLKHRWPSATITAMCQAPLGTLLKNDPAVDEVFEFHRVSGWIRRSENRDVIGKLQQGHYDLGVLLTNSFSSAYWFWRGGVSVRVGYQAFGRNLLLSKAIGQPARLEKMHQVIAYKRILREMGIAVSSTVPQIYLDDQEILDGRDLLESLGVTEHNTVVGINPAAAFGPAKQWPTSRFREVVSALIDDPLVRVVVFGDRSGASVAREVCQGMSDQVINLAGKTSLREFAALVKCCNVFISNDSGPMHLAAALKVPLVALFGSTSPERTSPYEWGKVICKNVDCSPCYKRECPIDFRCMLRIEVDEVIKAAKRELERSTRRA